MLDKAVVREIAENYAGTVRRHYNPKQIILFGSYVNGTPHKNSDIDIAVIFDNMEGNWLDEWGRLFQLCEGISFDIEAHMLDETCDRSGFLEHIRNTGEVLYQA
ncbi:MAG: nucleotidyltransferase domain-containing protein [Defluviitaleaceae bacterium]|nr:nucleotidyltransferase domain-containing protein [Defluviitaleaceae bacterium]